MHNQDTAKDDVMEAIFELLRKMKDYYDKMKKGEVNQENKEEIEVDNESSNTNQNKILRFQEAMKSIIESDANEQVKSIAQTFYDHPKDSMKMLQSIVSEQAVEQANELASLTNETAKMIRAIKSDIDMSKPNAMDQLAMLNQLEKQENKKLDLANSLVKEMKPLDKEEENEKEKSEQEKEKEPKIEIVREDIELDEPER